MRFAKSLCVFLQKSFHNSRAMSTQPALVLRYKDYGEPKDVLTLCEEHLKEPSVDEVLVKWLLAPVNPADINTIQGKYPSKPPLPAVPGNEGVGEIVRIGKNVTSFAIGDKVIPNINNLGTWRSRGVFKGAEMFKIPEDLGLLEASMLTVNPCTAYRMLKDFVPLEPGSTVIQNGGNSAVGQLVIQLCKTWNINTVNIVRDRPDIQCLKTELSNLGATEVLTEEELRTTDIFKSKKLPRPKLALNCICGKNAVEVQRHLDNNGVMVTYGGMSREPLTIPVSSLIFKDISFKGFWMTAWTRKNQASKERAEMFDELFNLFLSKKLNTPPHKLVSLCNFQEAVADALGGKQGVKYILDMTTL